MLVLTWTICAFFIISFELSMSTPEESIILNPKEINFGRCCQFCRAAGVIAQQTLPITATTFENAPREYMGLSTKKEIVEFIDNGYTTTDRLQELQD